MVYYLYMYVHTHTYRKHYTHTHTYIHTRVLGPHFRVQIVICRNGDLCDIH